MFRVVKGTIIITQNRKYKFTFSSDDEEEEKQGKIKQRDQSVLSLEFNDQFEPPDDGCELQVEKRNLFLLVFRKDIDGLIEQ